MYTQTVLGSRGTRWWQFLWWPGWWARGHSTWCSHLFWAFSAPLVMWVCGLPSGGWLQTFSHPSCWTWLAIDATVVAMSWNSRLNHTIQVQGPLQEMKKPLGLCKPCLFHGDWGVHLSATNELPCRCGDASDLGKGSHLPSQTTGFWQFKGWLWTVTALCCHIQTFRILPLCFEAHPWMPEIWQVTQGC